MKTSKRLLSILLMLAMLVSMFTVMAFADDGENKTATLSFSVTGPGKIELRSGNTVVREITGSLTLSDMSLDAIDGLEVVAVPDENCSGTLYYGSTEISSGLIELFPVAGVHVFTATFTGSSSSEPEPEPTPTPTPTPASDSIELKIAINTNGVKNAKVLLAGTPVDDTGRNSITVWKDMLKNGLTYETSADVDYNVSWELDGVEKSTRASYTLPADLEGTCTLTVTFTAKQIVTEHTLTVKANKSSRGYVQCGSTKDSSIQMDLEKNNRVTFKAVAKSGYNFSNWYSDDITILDAKDSTLEIRMPDKDVTVTAVFVEKSDSSHSHKWVTKYNDTYHWLECSKCGAETGKVKHTIKSKTDRHGYWYDYCTECDWTSDYNYNHSSSHKGYTYEEINSTYHWKTCKDCNYSVKEYHTWIRNTDRRTNDTYPYVCKYCDALSRTTYSDLPFHDVSDRYWYYDDVLYAYLNGLMDGISVTSFGADQNTTRGQVVTILWRLSGEPRAARNNQFTDVASSAYYNTAISWAAENGIVKGYDAKTFRPNANVTREQLAAILYRYAEYMNLSTKGASNLTKFDDYYSIGAWARDSLAWANYHGLINGVDSYRIDPKGNTTRAQLAAILHRFAVEFA